MHAKKSQAKNRNRDRARLAALRAALSANPEGKKLLALAQRQGVPISFSGKPKKNGAVGLFDIEDRTVTLDPGEKDGPLGTVLAHELRHLWQSGVAKVREREISAADMLVRRRVIEGDACAYEMRFQLSSQWREIDNLSKLALKAPKSTEARAAMKIVNGLRAKFGMKAQFIKVQKNRMGPYDKMTLRSLSLQLKLAQALAQEKKFLDAHPSKAKKVVEERRKCNGELKQIFNQASAPRPLDDSLCNITREGLSRGSPNYLGFTAAKDLAAFVRRQIPAKTLQKAKTLEKKIRKTAGQALRRRPDSR
jgi:hypothetical protein